MLKLIYLAKRKLGFTPDEFTRRWRMHGATGMAQPLWRHTIAYIQAEPIRPVPIAGASEDYDAVACVMMKEDAFTAPPILPDDANSAQILAKDELETFSGPIPGVTLFVHEEVLKPGVLGGTTGFLLFEDAAKARSAARLYIDAAGLNRLIVNVKRNDAAIGHMQNTLPFDAVVEVSATDLDRLRAILSESAGLAQADVAVVTREAVLWDRLAT